MISSQHAGAWREARALLRAHRRALVAGLGLVLLNRVAALALPASSKYAIDEVIGNGRTDLLWPLAGAAAIGVGLQAATAFGLVHCTGLAAERAVTRLRQELYAHALRLPVRNFDSTPTGTIVSRLMTDAEQIRTVLGPGLVQLASSVLSAGLALGVLAAMDAPLTAFLFVILLLLAWALTRAFGWFRGVYVQMSVLQGELTSRLNETLGGIRVVKAFAAERQEIRTFARTNHRILRSGARAATGLSLLSGMLTLATGLISVLLLVLLARNVAAGSMTLGDLALYVLLVGLLVTPLLQTAALGSHAGRALSALQRIHELRTACPETADDIRRHPLPQVTGDVVFDDVSYAYVPGLFALRHVSFDAPPGSTTALVGRSGSGKSTICRLLLAFDDPTLGRVLVDGRDLAALRRRAYRAHLAAVLQDGVLFDGTIADNIRYGRPNAAQNELRDAARLAHCEEFVSRLPRGYETPVGERGVKLSGGQRQRIAIARAMLMNPRLLILDEASTHLDPESEVLLQDALRSLMRGRTTFVVSHRFATVRQVDQILVIDRGRITERGTHRQLLLENGPYARTYALQGGARSVGPTEEALPAAPFSRDQLSLTVPADTRRP